MFNNVSWWLPNLDHKRILEQKLVLKQWFSGRLRCVTKCTSFRNILWKFWFQRSNRANWYVFMSKGKGKGHAHNRPRRPKLVPGRLRPRICLTLGTTRVVGRQPHAPAAFTPRRIPWYSFLEAESNPGHMVPLVATEKIPSVTPPGIDPETVRLVARRLNHYATPLPCIYERYR
jgi:hypothetical protein